MNYNYYHKFFFILLIAILFNNFLHAQEAYFDISDKEIQIQTDFNGKEVIIFGLTDSSFDTILIIKGPKKNIKLSMKERIFGFWFDTKKIIYEGVPSIFFIASSSPIDEILNEDIIIKKGLLFDKTVSSLITRRNFINQNELDNWAKNLIRLQKDKGLFNTYELKIIDEKLFQTRVFFPNTAIPGLYKVNIYQIENRKIVSERNKDIIIKKTGMGNKIYQFAKNEPASYGILCILFAIISGLIAATVFRRF